jgi:beta-glucosidase
LKVCIRSKRHFALVLISGAALLIAINPRAQSQASNHAKSFPWSDTSHSPDQRADLVMKEMTLGEKISLLHGEGIAFSSQRPVDSNGGAGFTQAIPRLGIPSIQMADSAYGVTRGAAAGRYSTVLPNDLGAASAWDPQAAFEYGALIGRELRDEGYGMSLGGGVNLAREPRDGRTFEYLGEDPLLAGTLDGNFVLGVQSQHIIGDLKHYAINDQESGRNSVNANIDKRSMRETDLLAFQIALGISHAGAVMCSYNRVNGDYACENKYLLDDVLKHDFNFKGFVLSDWGGTHSTARASHAGLDQEQPGQYFFGQKLKQAVESGEISQQELDDHVHRILRTIFATGLFDDPVVPQVPDAAGGMEIARHLAEKSIVLLKNEKRILPLNSAELHSVVVIGGHADKGVLTGGGSAQVDSPGGSPVSGPPPGFGTMSVFRRTQWLSSSPFRALEAQFPEGKLSYIVGDNLASAASAAKSADVAIVFAYRWEAEGSDLETLALSDDQNRLIETVASANPRTVVVLETGSPVTMPWIHRVAGVLEAWYPGIRGGEAIADILTGRVNPSGKLAITFPRDDADLPHPKIAMPPPASQLNFRRVSEKAYDFASFLAKGLPPFQVYYDEKLEVGYKWYDAQNKPVLFPFGFGLSYSTYAYSDLDAKSGSDVTVSFNVTNTGSHSGTEIAEVYSSLPAAAGEPPKRLIGWTRISLAAGESKRVSVAVKDDRLMIYQESSDSWKLVPGAYTVMVGGSSQNLPLRQTIQLQ